MRTASGLNDRIEGLEPVEALGIGRAGNQGKHCQGGAEREEDRGFSQ